jgi:hypothetical protein
MGLDHNRTCVVPVAEQVGKSQFEEVLLIWNQIRALDDLLIVAKIVCTLRLRVISSRTLSQTTIISSPSTVTPAALELVRRPKVSPCVDVSFVASRQKGIPCSVVISDIVVETNTVSTAAVWAGSAPATNSCKTWETLAYARLEVATPTTSTLAV